MFANCTTLHYVSLCFVLFSLDQIDENLRTALQKDLLAMAPGLRVQVLYGL